MPLHTPGKKLSLACPEKPFIKLIKLCTHVFHQDEGSDDLRRQEFRVFADVELANDQVSGDSLFPAK